MAAQLGQGLIIEQLLLHGAAPDLVDASGHTLVYVAAVCESVEGGLGAIVRRVGGGVLDLRDALGLTPLMHASACGSLHNVKFLLRKKVDVSATDSVEGKTALHWAAGSDTPPSAPCITLLLKKARGLLESRDTFGRTPLVACAVSGCVEGLQALLEGGASVEAIDDEQRTPVHWATASGNYAVLPRLLEIGCPLNSGDVTGATPTHYAVQRTAEPYPDLLGPEEYEAAMEQCKNLQACLAVLLEEGAKVMVADQEGTTPLHMAAARPNNLEAISALLAKGADPVARDNQGMTPFHCAALSGVTESCQALLEVTGGLHGNDVDDSGRSAVHLAVLGGHTHCVGRLLEQGLTLDQSDGENRTPLQLAASLGLLPIVELLVSHGGHVTSSSEGAGPVHEAAANGHPEVLAYLLGEGAPVNEVVWGGATPLHYAVAGCHLTCVQVLLQHNADVNAMATNQQGDKATPLDYAPSDNTEILDLLTSMGAVTATDEEEIADTAVSEVVDCAVVSDRSVEDQAETLSLHSLTPTRPSLEPGPTFDLPPVLPPTPPLAPPPKAHLLQRALSMLRRDKKSEGSILSSAVGLYAAHATLLAAVVIGTPLGDKAVQVAHSVATQTTQELEGEGPSSALPDLVWFRDEAPPTPSPTPPPREPTPTPPPPTPPHPVEIAEDPYERRLRKAMAQLDTGKSAGYLAVEELVRAGDTRARLRRDFESDQLKAHLQARKEEFLGQECHAREASNKVLQRLAQRMSRAEQSSEEISSAIEAGLEAAREENSKLAALMADMGLSPRPTVAQWLQAKDKARRTSLQSSLINWDRSREERHTSLLLQQARTSQRALRHAAWGAKKELSGRIRKLRQVYNPHTLAALPRPHSTHLSDSPASKSHSTSLRQPKVRHKNKVLLRKSTTSPPATSWCVQATPRGFLRVPSSVTTPTTPIETVWADGHDFARGHTHSRAIGPKTVHAEQTLHFVRPEEYKVRKKRLTQLPGAKGQKSKTSLSVTSIDFETRSGRRHSDSYSGPHYVSHISSDRRRSPRQPQQLTPVAT